MYIRCWGSRGSIPVSGRKFIKYGGDTTCMEIRSAKGDVVVVDAGTGLRDLGHKLAAEKVRSITLLFTHAHLDHLFGLPFFAPLYIPGTRIRIMGDPLGQKSVRDIVAGLLHDPYFPIRIDSKDVKARIEWKNISDRPLRIGGMNVRPVQLTHPNNGGLGYKFSENGKNFVFLTDNELNYAHAHGLPFGDYVAFCKDADLLIHDAEYTSKDYNRSWGHSLFTDAVDLAMAAGVKRLGLFHLNNMRTDIRVDAMVREAQGIVREHRAKVSVFAVGTGYQITL